MGFTRYELAPGTQIVYVPDHAKQDISHPDCEPGFVVDGCVVAGGIMCRFWRKPELKELRTKANGEWVRMRNIVVGRTVPQERVEQALKDDQGSRLIQNLV